MVYSGTVNPTGPLCIVDNGLPVNCGLTPVADENWFVNSLAAGVHKLSATYAGDAINGGSTSGTATLAVGSPYVTRRPRASNERQFRHAAVNRQSLQLELR